MTLIHTHVRMFVDYIDRSASLFVLQNNFTLNTKQTSNPTLMSHNSIFCKFDLLDRKLVDIEFCSKESQESHNYKLYSVRESVIDPDWLVLQ